VKELTSLDYNEALRYLGYSGEHPDDNTMLLMKKAENQLLSVIRPRYLFKAFDIEHTENIVILNNCTLTLTGQDIYNHLKNCSKAILMCATLSVDVDKAISTAQVKDMTMAVIMDSLASVAIEAVCDNAEKEILLNFKEYHNTFRYSPGYGDFPIEIQRDFLNVLDAPKRIGLSSTANSLLLPRKSVTAVIGLSENQIEKKKQSCLNCKLFESCLYRKRGVRCAD